MLRTPAEVVERLIATRACQPGFNFAVGGDVELGAAPGAMLEPGERAL